MDEATRQVAACLYVALTEAAGGAHARRVVAQVIEDAIEDRAINDAAAINFLTGLATDDDLPFVNQSQLIA